tara:strand:- start:1275 stop:1907 length:633 start_codon:yes stop_codon:yes gene_type:complete
MSYRRKRKAKAKKNRAKALENFDLSITADSDEKYINGVKVGTLDLTADVPDPLRTFSWMDDIRPYIDELEPGYGVNIPFHVINQGLEGSCLSPSAVVKKFSGAVKRFFPEKLLSVRTITKSGGRRIKLDDPVKFVRISQKAAPVLKLASANDTPKQSPPEQSQYNLNLKVSKSVYGFVYHQSQVQKKTVSDVVEDIVMQHSDFWKRNEKA